MNKQIAVERIFSLGDYQNIKFTDTITEIPEVIASNAEAMKLLRYLQLVDIEWSYIRYQALRANEPKLATVEAIAEAIEFIEKERTTTFEMLLKSIQENQ